MTRRNQSALSLLAIFFGFFTCNVEAQTLTPTEWTNGGGDFLWSNTANWSAGLPTETSLLSITTASSTPPTIGVDLGIDRVVVGAISVAEHVTSDFTFERASVESLQVNGGIVSAVTPPMSGPPAVITFNLPVFAGGAATWEGYVNFQNTVNLGIHSITVPSGNPLTFGSNASVVFGIGDNAASYGRFLTGIPNFASSLSNPFRFVLTVEGAYTGGHGHVFNLLPGAAPSHYTLDLPELAGFSWDDSDFAAHGTLTLNAIPEAGTLVLLVGGLAALFGLSRRRRITSEKLLVAQPNHR